MFRMMGRGSGVRTGIDLGTVGVKLVRAEGTSRLERISHVGLEEWNVDGSGTDTERATEALRTVLQRLGLVKRDLGHVAVAVGGADVRVREVVIPPVDAKELQASTRFEAKKHLDLDDMDTPLVTSQLLGRTSDGADGLPPQSRALFAAIPRARRDFAVSVLAGAGLEPEVVDLEPLSALNQAIASGAGRGDEAIAVLDVGGRQTSIHIAHRDAGFLSRHIGPGSAATENGTSVDAFLSGVARRTEETMTFYRGRHRQEVGAVFLIGGGSLLSGSLDFLRQKLEQPVSGLDPLEEVGESGVGYHDVSECGSRFVVACGLCRWWDDPVV